jgi:hypothetical protein
MKVLPMSVDGTPSNFRPHPFASYDWYNQARIRKRPATRGKHPSGAVDKQQRVYMDFGFLRASQADYSRPDKTKERVVTSFDGYNSYLLIVDEYTKYVWVYLCVSKEPPIELINLHLDQFNTKGYIRCDQGGELAGCDEFVTSMAKRGFTVEPTGADSPNQNKQAERWNDTFGITTRVLLYGSGLPAEFWSAALLMACYIHNQRVHRSILMTPFEAYHGFKPDVCNLRVFGSRVCVKRTGKRRSKLHRHDFTGTIFLGYTATDENISYIDVHSRIVKTSHHAIFDEAWYLQLKRPPFAQMLYDVGLEPELDPITVVVESEPAPPPPLPDKAPTKAPLFATRLPLPLRISTAPSTFTAAAAKSTMIDDMLITESLPKKRLEHELIMAHDISKKDIECVYLSPSSFRDSFEEVLDLRRFDPSRSATAGLMCELKNGRVYLRQMLASTPGAKIRAWRTRLCGAWIIKIAGKPIHSIDDVATILSDLKSNGATSCTILMAHSALRDGLVETGIPQVNVDQLNNRYSLDSIDVMSQEQFDRWFSSLPASFY